MANAISRRRRAYNSDINDEGTVPPEVTGYAPYELSRAALRNRYGTRRIDASAPMSPLDSTPSTPGVMGGRTPSSTWDTFFRKPSLGSTTPVDATSLAETSSLFSPKVPFTPMASKTPDSLFNTAIQDHEAWFNAQGMSIPSPGGGRMARAGDRFTSKYGTGTVGINVDTMKKLALLGVDEDLF